MPDDLLAVGIVRSTHGVTGELKVLSLSGGTDHLLGLRDALFRKGRTEKALRLASVRAQPPGVIVKIEGLDTPEAARSLVGFEVWVPRAQASPLGRGEYYAADLCRCLVWYREEEIGPVRSVLDAGPGQLLEVLGKGGKVFMVPFTDHFVGDVNLGRRRIELRVDEVVR